MSETMKRNIGRWLQHYLYGCFATAWNDSITAVASFMGIAVGAAMDPQVIQTPNWHMVMYVFGTNYVFNVIKYFSKNPIPTSLGTNSPFPHEVP